VHFEFSPFPPGNVQIVLELRYQKAFDCGQEIR
jgi:hypothetical protein